MGLLSVAILVIPLVTLAYISQKYPKFFSILGEMCGITVYDIDMDIPHDPQEINYNMTRIGYLFIYMVYFNHVRDKYYSDFIRFKRYNVLRCYIW